ncbi:glycosyltransferase, partial [Bacillus sp. JJ1566]|uniref:glycosyltransferase n=1 Tax=Bacillus sp. JJ1566 TaxID=3122961 RepID=UPI002FFE4198
MGPVVSIIVPVYNVEKYLSSCIDSILAQTLTDIEVILVNDGSTDHSGKICDEYAASDTRVKVIHKEYGGVSSARNVGVGMAQGEYIGFVDSDDRIEQEMYMELYHLCKDTSSDISICILGREMNGKIINQHNNKIYTKLMDNEEAMKQLFKGELYRFSLCNKLFKKSCFVNIIFPEGRIHEDLATTYKLFSNANRVVYKNFIGYIYIKRQNSLLTSSFNEKRLDAFIAWNEILNFMIKRYENLFDEIIASFGYWSVDNFYYILNQVDDSE